MRTPSFHIKNWNAYHKTVGVQTVVVHTTTTTTTTKSTKLLSQKAALDKNTGSLDLKNNRSVVQCDTWLWIFIYAVQLSLATFKNHIDSHHNVRFHRHLKISIMKSSMDKLFSHMTHMNM